MNSSVITKGIIPVLLIILLSTCGKRESKEDTLTIITNPLTQDTIFKKLLEITNFTIPEGIQDDSLSFLLLPLDASCPYCRDKTIDSIVINKDKIGNRRFIILSANAGLKNISGYFRGRDKNLPVIPQQLFIDSTSQATKTDLIYDKPTIYYTYERKAFQKVASIPATVKDDLHQFFSGEQNNNQVAKKEK